MTDLLLEGVRLPGADAPTAVRVRDGHVVALGPGAVAGVGAGPPPDTERIDLDGRRVLPGLWDTHAHLEQWAVARRRIDLRDADGPAAVADLVARAATRARPGEAIVGWGFRYGAWDAEPHKDLLEAAAPGRLVVASSIDLHTAWFSPAALAHVGAGDHPTGVLREGACFAAMSAFVQFDEAAVDRWVLEAVSDAAAAGITGIIDFEVGDSLPAWRRRSVAGPVAARIVCTVYPDHLDAAIARGLPTGATAPGTHGVVEVGPLKLFLDGSLNSRTALCHEPYPGDGGHGQLELPPEVLHATMRTAAAAGIETAVHAIGDRAVSLALDAFEVTGLPGRIEHAQLVAPRDVGRLARPGLTVGVQPAHLLDDRDVTDRHWPGRSHRAFPLAEMLAAGARVEFGSDAPVAPLDPWLAIRAAVTRTGDERPPWHPEQRLALADAMACSSRGRRDVRVGDPADLVVLDRDPEELTGGVTSDRGVAGTLCAGRWTFRAF